MTVVELWPQPLTGGQVAAVPLRVLAGPAPGRVAAVAVHYPSRALADRWPPSGVVECPGCGAPVRGLAEDVLAAVLGDVDPPDPDADCLWCGPGGQARAGRSS